jgi:hypothetical protein
MHGESTPPLVRACDCYGSSPTHSYNTHALVHSLGRWEEPHTVSTTLSRLYGKRAQVGSKSRTVEQLMVRAPSPPPLPRELPLSRERDDAVTSRAGRSHSYDHKVMQRGHPKY